MPKNLTKKQKESDDVEMMMYALKLVYFERWLKKGGPRDSCFLELMEAIGENLRLMYMKEKT